MEYNNITAEMVEQLLTAHFLCVIICAINTVETGHMNTGYKYILTRNVSIRPGINFTGYKNMPVIRTFFYNDVLINGFH